MEKKNSRQGISAEVFGQFNQKADYIAKVIAKSTAVKEEIKTLIENSSRSTKRTSTSLLMLWKRLKLCLDKQSLPKEKKEILYTSLMKESMTALRSLMENRPILKLTLQEISSVNLHLCIMLQELLLSNAKLQEKCTDLID